MVGIVSCIDSASLLSCLNDSVDRISAHNHYAAGLNPVLAIFSLSTEK